MAKPWVHAKSSAKRWGGKPENYIDIHNFMDSSKSAICDNRHRAILHHSWAISNIIERIFGLTLINSDGKEVSTREVAEWHVFEDFGMKYIPSASDYLNEIEMKDWMNNGMGKPPESARKLMKRSVDNSEPVLAKD